MKITIEQTDEIMLIEDSEHGGMVRARLWQGETDSGIPVHCFVTLIAPTVPESDPDIETKAAQFGAELQRVHPKRPEIGPIPLRMIL